MGPAVAQSPKAPALDAEGLLPPDHDPRSVPANDGSGNVPAVPISDRTNKAIQLFDSGSKSERHYDLVNCLDGITFGFANHPQASLPGFFRDLRKDADANEALVRRFVEVFQASKDAWSAFAKKAGLSASDLSADAVGRGIDKVIANVSLENWKPAGSNCSPPPTSGPAPGQSFYYDNYTWFHPAARRAFRDPAVVAFQVRRWEKRYLDPAARDAKAMGFEGDPGVFLMAFIWSNPGEVSVGHLQNSKAPPAMLRAGGKDWSWNTPPAALSKVSKERWRQLLLWQAICRGEKGERMRSRTIAFYKEYLADQFVLPSKQIEDAANCDPEKITLR
jgi:hypothetical protein